MPVSQQVSLKLEQLKLDLALRYDNVHAGSGLGGNEKEFLKLLSYQTIIGYNVAGGISLIGDAVFFDQKLLDKEPLVNLRALLTERLAPVIDFPYVIQNEIIDLANCDVLAKQLLPAAAKRDAFIKACGDLQHQEIIDNIRFHASETYKEKDLSSSQLDKFETFQKLKENEKSAYNKDLRKIYRRYDIISDKSITREEANIWEKINKFPSYIVLYSIRYNLGVDRMVKYNHDKFVHFIAEKNR